MVLGPDGADYDGSPRLVDGARSWTRRQAVNAVARTVQRLRDEGLAAGDQVLAPLDHDPAGVFFLAAAGALGLRVLMPYNLHAAALPEWRNIIASARPDVVVHLKR